MRTRTLTRKRLRNVLHYTPETGIFTWTKALSSRTVIGSRAGNVSRHSARDYRKIRIDGVLHFEHRLAWFYMTGRWPSQEIDHKDGDGLNNRWSNLRQASHGQNACNTGPNRKNTSGAKGVYFRRDTGKWSARLQHEGTIHHLGCFPTFDAARAAYREAAMAKHGEFARPF